jgi:hypothetical protein
MCGLRKVPNEELYNLYCITRKTNKKNWEERGMQHRPERLEMH